MIKNTFTITASADGTIVLSETPVFNKLESGVTKLLFTLPNMTGYAYLLARHDRKEWYAIPIDSENKIMMGQTVTRLHGRWAFNVCISSNLITDDPQTENIVYMSDVFEGLVYDNVSDDHQPSALEPNVLKIVNNAQNIYEQFVSKFDEVEDDLIQAANNLTLAQTAANSATSNAAAASTSATNAAASATTALGYKTAAESAKDAAVVAQTSAQTWSGKAYEHLVAAREAQADAEDARDDAETYKDAAEAAAEAAARSAGANSIDYDGTNHKLTISVAGSDLDSAVIATDSALDNASTAYVENKTITHEVDYSNYNNSNVYNYDAVSESLTETTFSSGISSSGTSTTSIIKAIAQVVKEINNVVKQIANALKLYAKKDSLANVATSGSYNDLSDVPETTAVSVTAIETSGTHIADIEVDGTTTEIYAPEGGSDVEIVTEWETTTSDEKVPSEKLVKTSLESLNDDIADKQTTIPKLTQTQYDTLIASGSVVVDGKTITYNANDIYEVDDGGTYPIKGATVGYNGATSGLSATNVQDAIDSVISKLTFSYGTLDVSSGIKTINCGFRPKRITIWTGIANNSKYLYTWNDTMGAQYRNNYWTSSSCGTSIISNFGTSNQINEINDNGFKFGMAGNLGYAYYEAYPY